MREKLLKREQMYVKETRSTTINDTTARLIFLCRTAENQLVIKTQRNGEPALIHKTESPFIGVSVFVSVHCAVYIYQ